jgi:hypothetical protein
MLVRDTVVQFRKQIGTTVIEPHEATYAGAQVIVGVDPDPENYGRIMDWAKAYHGSFHPHGAGVPT